MFVLLLLVVYGETSTLCSSAESLRILSLLPYADSDGLYGWDRGLELLPAARIAVRHINQQTNVLPGYQIELIEQSSDACGRDVVTRGLQNLVGSALTPDRDANAIAVVGLACSAVTRTVSPVAGRFDLLQVAIANSQLLRDRKEFPHLWRVISTSDVLVDATIMLMERFNWQRVGLLSDGNFFFQAIAKSFRAAARIRNFTIVVDEGLDSNPSTINTAISRIQSQGVRIIFSPTTLPESVEIICQAAKNNLIWPGYVWIFPSRIYEEFLESIDLCDDQELFQTALENITLVGLELSGRNGNVTLVSGITYDEFRAEYEVEYRNVQDKFPDVVFSSTYNVYANAMYDEVWALALAINSSLPELEEKNLKLTEYGYDMPEITQIFERQMKNVTFSGALTNVHFNEFNEVPTSVNVFQVRDNVSILIGQMVDNNLMVLNISKSEIPGDDFVRKYNLLSDDFVIPLYVLAAILLVMTSVLLIMTLLLRKEPEILAISPLLSVLVFVGCYQLICASVLASTHNYVAMPSELYIVICYITNWSSRSGINFITTTVLIRLVRIYRVFTHFGKTSKFWQDKYLFVTIIVISCCPDLITVVGLIVDRLQVKDAEEYFLDENPPVIQLTRECVSDHGFSNISYVLFQAYTALLIILLLAFAILTRKVNKKNFKDTKKILVFVFLFTIVATVSGVISYLFNSINLDNVAIVVSSYSYQLMTLLCLTILIAPKALPAFYYRVLKKEKRSFHAQASKDMTISKTLIATLHNVKSKQNLRNGSLATQSTSTNDSVF